MANGEWRMEGGRKSRYSLFAMRDSRLHIWRRLTAFGGRNFGRIARAMVWPGPDSKLARWMGREARWTAAFGAAAALAPADDIC
jgi:hypothetical protein